MEKVIEVKELSFAYYQNLILKNINFSVNKGDFLCIVGENGSGKSTLIKCILGLNKVEKGEITVQSRIGYLPQMTEIQSNFPATIEEIVLSGTIPDDVLKVFYTRENKEKAYNIMKQLNLYDMRKKCFYDLSGGQRQRVLIARALCSTKDIILLDEPVNGLDPKIVYEIYKLLAKINKEEKITIVMVSHDVDRALEYANRVIEIEHGEIKQDVDASKYKIGGVENGSNN